MKLLELTLSTAAENLAIDEALLEMADQAESDNAPSGFDVFRLWEPQKTMAVIGSNSKTAVAICAKLLPLRVTMACVLKEN